MATGPTFDDLLVELRQTRNHYEDLRIHNGSLADRAAIISRLHTLRSAIAELRSSI